MAIRAATEGFCPSRSAMTPRDEAVACAVRPVEADRIGGGEGADQRIDAVRVLEREGRVRGERLDPVERAWLGAVACTANHLSSTSGLSR